MTFRVVVMASGAGTLLQALIDVAHHQDCPFQIVAVVSDVPDAKALDRARLAGIDTAAIPLEPFARPGTPRRRIWDQQLTGKVQQFHPDLIVLAGFMKLVGHTFTAAFPRKVINTHPSLLPSFPGAHAVRDALNAGVTETGASIFWVDDGVDTGELIGQRQVPVRPGDTEETLHEHIKVVERALVVETVKALAAG